MRMRLRHCRQNRQRCRGNSFVYLSYSRSLMLRALIKRPLRGDHEIQRAK